MHFGIIVFPGTWSEGDCVYAIEKIGHQATIITEHSRNINNYDCLVIPGGFSYGDYLRAGAIASTSPIMEKVRKFAKDGGLVIGICNGFQILCESGLLPGSLMRNAHLEYRSQWINLKVCNTNSRFTNEFKPGQIIKIPISHAEGNYFIDKQEFKKLSANDQIVFQYCSKDGVLNENDNPNGSVFNIAGVMNEQKNVLGMMPHPERACEDLLGGTDGNLIFRSITNSRNLNIL